VIATIAKQFTFDAAHRLYTCPPEHKCHRLHGHTYTVEVVLTGPVKTNGFVVDYAQIQTAFQTVHAKLDHQYLNDVPGLEVPSTEVLAAWILRELVDGPNGDYVGGVPAPPWPVRARGRGRQTTLVTRVKVMESSTTWCEVETAAAGCKRIPWAGGVA
jgi:6-pyruvoyltetrahydropterin/6-carboxytetrahydropterin synthase